jgi:hypothetical protein
MRRFARPAKERAREIVALASSPAVSGASGPWLRKTVLDLVGKGTASQLAAGRVGHLLTGNLDGRGKQCSFGSSKSALVAFLDLTLANQQLWNRKSG